MQMANEVPEGRGADSRQGSGRFRGRKVMKFRRVPGQMADKVSEGSGSDSRQSSGGFRGRWRRVAA